MKEYVQLTTDGVGSAGYTGYSTREAFQPFMARLEDLLLDRWVVTATAIRPGTCSHDTAKVIFVLEREHLPPTPSEKHQD